jgi:D-lyxose ketol-isomerase
MKTSTARSMRKRTMQFLDRARIVTTAKERANIEIADFGLDDVEHIGLELIVYENNERYCAKELVLFPGQTCPQHRHPPRGGGEIGKQETFRCRWGEVYLYVEGEPTKKPKARVPEQYRPYMTVWKEIVLKPGDQFTLTPNSWHWFQAGSKGAVVSEFSSPSDDASDIWTDPNIKRLPVYE